jgi:hypothetical protein
MKSVKISNLLREDPLYLSDSICYIPSPLGDV